MTGYKTDKIFSFSHIAVWEIDTSPRQTNEGYVQMLTGSMEKIKLAQGIMFGHGCYFI